MQLAMFTAIGAQCSVSSSSLRVVSHWSSSSSSSSTPSAQFVRALSSFDSHLCRDKFLLEPDSARLNGETGHKKLEYQGPRTSYRGSEDRRASEPGKKPAGRNERPPTGSSDNRKPALGRDQEDVFVKRFPGNANPVNLRGDRRGDFQRAGDPSRQPDGGSRANWAERDRDLRGTNRETRVSDRNEDKSATTASSRSGMRRNNAVGRQGGMEADREADDERVEGAGRFDYGDGGEREKRDGGERFEKKKRVKEPPISPQIKHERLMNKDPEVAILGGGMAGLVCALTLEKFGIRSTVFDTGKHGLGGRMGTRQVELRQGAPPLVFDHAAQFFTVTDPRFQKLVDEWVSDGAVKIWNHSLGTLQAGGHYTELPPAARYVGSHGMRLLADHLVSKSKLIKVRRPVWISKMFPHNSRWKLSEYERPEGDFDAVVIAHNGKCANRLLTRSGAPFIYKQMKRMELSSIWALMAAFDDPLPAPQGVPGNHLSGAFVEGVDALTWIGDNTSKLDRDNAPHCYTFFSSAKYGKKNKVPQESIPVVRAQRVTREMLKGVEVALGLEEDSLPKPFYSKVQLWGAGLPTNTPGLPCIFDAFARVGICGDWLVGSSLEAAAISGMALAEHIADYRDRGDLNPEEFCVGLEKEFSEIDGHDIGQFPESSSQQMSADLQLVTA